jgi:hypothetical protein
MVIDFDVFENGVSDSGDRQGRLPYVAVLVKEEISHCSIDNLQGDAHRF